MQGKSVTVEPIIAGGFDGGNGRTKLVLPQIEKACPAYVLPIHGRLYDVPEGVDGAYVQYLKGTRVDLHGERWLTGTAAYMRSPNAYSRVRDDKKGKITYGLQVLLGIIGTLPYRDTWKLLLTVSIQDAQAFGDDLYQNLSGTHLVKCNSERESSIEIKVNRVVEEGIGAIVQGTAYGVTDGRKQNIIIDIGHGTIITSIFAPGGKLLDRSVFPYGVDSLYDTIAQNVKTRRELVREGDRELIRKGIENHTFHYGSTEWDFSEVYGEELTPWVEQNLTQALKAVDPWRDSSFALVAVGGGSELPGIEGFFSRKRIKTLPQGSWANPRGLCRISEISLSKGV